MSNAKTTRAKFRCDSVKSHEGGGDGQEVTLSAVTSGSEENESFFKSTPSGNLSISHYNPEVNFEEGKSYYLDFTEVEEATATDDEPNAGSGE